MSHSFKPGDRALFAYEEDIMEGTVQNTSESEIIIQFDGVSSPSSLEPQQLQHVYHDFDAAYDLEAA